MRNTLRQLTNIPVEASVIASCYPHLSATGEKVRALQRHRQILRLKRGLYVVNPAESGRDIDVRLCANHIYGPSYVSLQWALRWYGLIPERVHTITSITTKRSRRFENSLGRFTYRQVSPEYFSIGLTQAEASGAICLMATPEKALCDVIVSEHYVPARSVSGLYRFLEEDLRVDVDALSDFDTAIIESCAQVGMKREILYNLLKIVKR